jgi:hypothetical protein
LTTHKCIFQYPKDTPIQSKTNNFSTYRYYRTGTLVESDEPSTTGTVSAGSATDKKNISEETSTKYTVAWFPARTISFAKDFTTNLTHETCTSKAQSY